MVAWLIYYERKTTLLADRKNRKQKWNEWRTWKILAKIAMQYQSLFQKNIITNMYYFMNWKGARQAEIHRIFWATRKRSARDVHAHSQWIHIVPLQSRPNTQQYSSTPHDARGWKYRSCTSNHIFSGTNCPLFGWTYPTDRIPTSVFLGERDFHYKLNTQRDSHK